MGVAASRAFQKRRLVIGVVTGRVTANLLWSPGLPPPELGALSPEVSTAGSRVTRDARIIGLFI